MTFWQVHMVFLSHCLFYSFTLKQRKYTNYYTYDQFEYICCHFIQHPTGKISFWNTFSTSASIFFPPVHWQKYSPVCY